MKIAVTTLCWGKIKDKNEMQTVLHEAKSIGYQGIGLEFRLLPKELIKHPHKIAIMLHETGIDNAGGYFSLREEELDVAEKSGTTLLWIVARERDCSSAIEKIITYKKKSSEKGIDLALHNHLRTCFESEPEIVKLLEVVPDLKICLDTAHAEAAGINIINFIKKFSNKISLIHLKDLRARLPKSEVRFTRDFVNVGQGIIDFYEILSTLKDVGYDGYVMLEFDKMEREKVKEEIKKGYSYIRDILKKI
ncbi:sugar phosphate isomerase/epimerase family protein [Metallosphaera javensis (ex Sakai et al. 2022)]|uniref:sugar phosphate isomerase/epimerase family protein n=1 Tax=Metallosphaera javensis (ex Sakai et al. 2022) TaxID=2775498 RepID=UPI00258F16CD|nr:MAG: putative protein [Metallosphaera javensis (ex Sakai et al. 2022)]